LLRLLLLLSFPLLLSGTAGPFVRKSAGKRQSIFGRSRGFAARRSCRARAAFAKAIQENPRNAKAANALGLVMLAQNDAASAIPQFQTALRVQPSFVNARLNLCKRPVANARVQGAVREARSAVRIAPAEPMRMSTGSRSGSFEPARCRCCRNSPRHRIISRARRSP